LNAFLVGIAAFLLPLALYAVLVRMRSRTRSTRLLAPILLAGALLVVLPSAFGPLRGSVAEALLALALAWSLGIAFVMANTAIETDSPTQSLVLFLHDHRPHGVTEEQLAAFIAAHPFRDSRLQGLIADRLVDRQGERLVSRAASHALLDLLDAYRRLIRRDRVTG
jgi:predicted amidohydrolase